MQLQVLFQYMYRIKHKDRISAAFGDVF